MMATVYDYWILIILFCFIRVIIRVHGYYIKKNYLLSAFARALQFKKQIRYTLHVCTKRDIAIWFWKSVASLEEKKGKERSFSFFLVWIPLKKWSNRYEICSILEIFLPLNHNLYVSHTFEKKGSDILFWRKLVSCKISIIRLIQMDSNRR